MHERWQQIALISTKEKQQHIDLSIELANARIGIRTI